MKKQKFILVIIAVGFLSCTYNDEAILINDDALLSDGVNAKMKAASQQVYSIFMSPNGNDDNSGDSLNPIRTLAKAQEILNSVKPACNVEIRVRKGTYSGQSVVWRYKSNYWITIQSERDDSIDMPVFDGKYAPYSVQNWFTARVQGNSNLRFRFLKVQNYRTAIFFYGNKDSTQLWNCNNRLYGMHFNRIGAYFTRLKDDVSYSVVNLKNSRNNQISRCSFTSALNEYVPHNNLLHAIYIASFSINNTISYNHFEDIAGDPIRIRDRSNYNKINENTFVNSGHTAFYSDWHNINDNECRSYGNEFKRNTCSKGFRGTEISLFKCHHENHYCYPLPAPWLITYGNIMN